MNHGFAARLFFSTALLACASSLALAGADTQAKPQAAVPARPIRFATKPVAGSRGWRKRKQSREKANV